MLNKSWIFYYHFYIFLSLSLHPPSQSLFIFILISQSPVILKKMFFRMPHVHLSAPRRLDCKLLKPNTDCPSTRASQSICTV